MAAVLSGDDSGAGIGAAAGAFKSYQRALASGAFTEVRHEGSLRILERTAEGIG